MGAVDTSHGDSIVAVQAIWLADGLRVDLADDEREGQIRPRLTVKETGGENLHAAHPDEAALDPLEPAALSQLDLGQERHLPAETLPRQNRSVQSGLLEYLDARFSGPSVPQAFRCRFGRCPDGRCLWGEHLELEGTVDAEQRPRMR